MSIMTAQNERKDGYHRVKFVSTNDTVISNHYAKYVVVQCAKMIMQKR